MSFFYAEPQVGEAFEIANNSQNKINRENQEAEAQSLEAFENIKFSISDLAVNDDDIVENKKATAEKKAAFSSYRATAYCLKGRTAVGGGVRRGLVAADPRILPLGTRIQITAGNYSGTYTVADTGGAIRGKILDVWVPTCSEAMRFGRRSVSVSVLGR